MIPIGIGCRKRGVILSVLSHFQLENIEEKDHSPELFTL